MPPSAARTPPIRSPKAPHAAAEGAPRGCTNFKLRRLLRVVARRYDAHFARAGLKGTQFSLLSAIVATEPVRPAELARAMGLDASTLTRNLQVLVEQGWVVQGPGDDARSRRIEATAAGRTKQAVARRHWEQAQLELNAVLGVERVAALHALVDDGLVRLGEDDPDR
ncbi:MAG: MarR family winged helix-turn-helix transcriptional regulator [Burkholderiaceae bacterium]|jgi:DNA-binding MarR family transcriptional regulator|nr:winged helix-turn-helix transcriptional regulator [Burkholderiales bacterium]MCZ8106577.1 MarR family winged helix-turn-helix transcriptional regulator [Burkholderiales bacterium]MCZ8339858.1 MarR family winged helix-turn-helix transcriptional regulator [Burkholderiaceae bacterium]